MRPRLYINRAADLDWLIALEFGRVDDGQPSDCWLSVSENFAWLRDGPDGRFVGFKILDFSTFDASDAKHASLWAGPRFDAPLVGLANATAGEIALATDALLDDHSTVNRHWFSNAVRNHHAPDEAAIQWLVCLQAGDSMAHFGLGCALYDLGRHREAYRHLRHYTELAPHSAWSWCWYGKAAEAIGEPTEAMHAYREALRLEALDGSKTEAGRRLDALDSPW